MEIQKNISSFVLVSLKYETTSVVLADKFLNFLYWLRLVVASIGWGERNQRKTAYVVASCC